MKLLGRKVKDVYFLLELSLEELKQLKFVLDNSTISFNGEVKEEKDAQEYVVGEFYTFICTLIEDEENALG